MGPLQFIHDGKIIYEHSFFNCAPGELYIPRQGDYIRIINREEPVTIWNVTAVEWYFERTSLIPEGEMSCMEPSVIVYLRRLRPGEAKYPLEPSGYEYLSPIFI